MQLIRTLALRLSIAAVVLVFFAAVVFFHSLSARRQLAANQRLVNAILANNHLAAHDAIISGADPNAEVDFASGQNAIPILARTGRTAQLHVHDTPILIVLDCLVSRGPATLRVDSDAVPVENLDMMKTLVAAGAKVNVRNNTGNTPLNMAVMWGYRDTVHFLLTHGANPNLLGLANSPPCVFASADGNVPIVKELLDSGANPDTQDSKGMTALFWTTIPKETPNLLQSAQLLLKHKANPQIKDNTGITALENAIRHNNRNLVKLLTNVSAH